MGPRRRRGTAAVETAVCLPVLLLIVFGAIEACTVIFLQQALQATAYESARVAAAPNNDVQAARDVGQSILAHRKVQGGSIQVTSSPMPGFTDTELVTATVTAPVASNRVFPAWALDVAQLSAECTMVKEIVQ